MTPTLTIKEWQELPIGGDSGNSIAEKDAQRVHALAEKMTRRLKVPHPVLTRTARSGLRAGQVVGVLATSGINLEILPKIDSGDENVLRRSLVRMLSVARNLPIADHELTQLDIQHENLLEIFIRIFSNRLLEAVRRGLPHRYLRYEDDLPRLRGKLLVARQFTRNAVRPDRFACVFDEFSADTPLNRVLKATVVRLLAISKSDANRRKLAELLSRFDSVGKTDAPMRERVKLDRTNRSYHQLYSLARLILARDWQSTTTGRGEGFSLLFPMNDLFEEYIGRSLKIELSPRDVKLQDMAHYAIDTPKRRFQLRPDIVIDGSIIVDTKWKQLKPGKSNFGIEQSDIYQLLAYANAYRSKRVILLYPWHKGLISTPGTWQQWQASGTDMAFEISTVDVSRPVTEIRQTLRQIISNRPAAIAA